MALPGELNGLDGCRCMDCGNHMDLDVQKSPAGYYLGYFCPRCGPYSRETGYYQTRKKAEIQLEATRRGMSPEGLRDENHSPGDFETRVF